MSTCEPATKPQTAAELCRHFKLSDDAQQLLGSAATPAEFFTPLVRKELYLDALRLAAYDLPKREAIWWGSLCLWRVHRSKPPQKLAGVLQAVLDWLRDPNEENRRAADRAGKEAGIDSPAGSLATAVFFSGGSISLPGLPEVESDPFATAQNVASAVVLASKKVKPERISQCQREFLVLAADVASGCLPWETTPVPARLG